MRPGLDEVKRTTSSTSWPRCCLCQVQSHLSWTRLQSWGWRLRISDSESSLLMEILLGTGMEDSMENLRLKVSCLTSIFLTCFIRTRIQSIDTAELEIFSINQIYISFFDLLSRAGEGGDPMIWIVAIQYFDTNYFQDHCGDCRDLTEEDSPWRCSRSTRARTSSSLWTGSLYPWQLMEDFSTYRRQCQYI